MENLLKGKPWMPEQTIQMGDNIIVNVLLY